MSRPRATPPGCQHPATLLLLLLLLALAGLLVTPVSGIKGDPGNAFLIEAVDAANKAATACPLNQDCGTTVTVTMTMDATLSIPLPVLAPGARLSIIGQCKSGETITQCRIEASSSPSAVFMAAQGSSLASLGLSNLAFVQATTPIVLADYMDLSATNVTFQDNSVAPIVGNGGPSLVRLRGCVFSGNKGGCISGQFGSESASLGVDAEGTLFHNTQGGAVLLQGGRPALFSHCSFTGNSAEGSGGALSVLRQDVELRDSQLSGNRAWGEGGALLAYEARVTIGQGVVFYKNAVDGDTASSGGAAYILFSSLKATGAEFSSNSASGSGGAVYAYRGSLSLRAVSFQGNTAVMDGGALYAWDSALEVKLSHFKSNAVSQNGGAVRGMGSAMVMDQVHLEQNTAGSGGALFVEAGCASNRAAFGGAIQAQRTNLGVEHSEFRNDSADVGGSVGAKDSTVKLLNTAFFRNSAGRDPVLFAEALLAPVDVTFCSTSFRKSYGTPEAEVLGSESGAASATTTMCSTPRRGAFVLTGTVETPSPRACKSICELPACNAKL